MAQKQPKIKLATVAHAANVDPRDVIGGRCDGCGVRTSRPGVDCSRCSRDGMVSAESGHANPYSW